MALREPFPGLGEILVSIGDGGMRSASFDAAEGAPVEAFDVRATIT